MRRIVVNLIRVTVALTFLAAAVADSPPNMVIIIADDLGIGDLSCFGNHSFKTRHVDRLAAEGARLTHHVAAASLCTPSRTALLTGRYPVRSGMQEAHGGPPVVRNVFATAGLPQTETTFARALLDAGYRTKYVGKWHQGWSCESWQDQCHGPLKHGFQSFFGLPFTLMDDDEPSIDRLQRSGPFLRHVLPEVLRGDGKATSDGDRSHGDLSHVRTASALWKLWLDMVREVHYGNGSLPRGGNWWSNIASLERFMIYQLVRDNEVVSWPYQLVGLTQRLLDESLEYIRSSARRDKPFLLVHSFLHVHTPMFTAPPFWGVSGHSRYADNVLEMDWAVGQLLDSLEAAGVVNNTIVHFVSDHGAGLELVGADGQREGGSNWPFRGGKGQGGTEGGVRVPAVFRWPGRIVAGLRVDVPTSSLDLMPTLLEAAGLTVEDLTLDGHSMLDLLRGRSQVSTHRVLLHFCGADVHAVRYVPEDMEAVYKLYLKVPRYPDPTVQHCGVKNGLCSCYGDHVIELTTPQLFDVQSDPSEISVISTEDVRYKKYVPLMLQAMENHHQAGIGLTSQMESFDRVMPRPELVPWDQLSKFRGVEFDVKGHSDWLEYSEGSSLASGDACETTTIKP